MQNTIDTDTRTPAADAGILFTPRAVLGNVWGAPRYGTDAGRIHLTLIGVRRLNDVIDGEWWSPVDTDRGRMLAVKIACGAACRCDAAVVPVDTPDDVLERILEGGD